MQPISRRVLCRALIGASFAGLAACGRREPAAPRANFAGNTPRMQALIARYARQYDLPESLLHRVIRRESGYNPEARNGPYYGLMQIMPQTAATMGYDGPPDGLLDAETNLRYAGKYLRGAWLVSRRDEDEAIGWYSRGYYYEAKRMGLLEETGLRA